jgi:uncharacterized protein
MTFTKGVKDAQVHYGTRAIYAKQEGGPESNAEFSDAEADFIEQMDGFYFATVSETGSPYIQFRGGKPGFLKVLDERTLGFADFRGNLQYISVGNLASNTKAALLLMDYAHRRRLKILATVEIRDAAGANELIELLRVADYKAKVERAVILHLDAFDWNCPQHITAKYTLDQISGIVAPLHERIAKLEKENAGLKGIK